jgi:hypothetical protein
VKKSNLKHMEHSNWSYKGNTTDYIPNLYEVFKFNLYPFLDKTDKAFIRKVRNIEKMNIELVKDIKKIKKNQQKENDKPLLVEVLKKSNYYINSLFGYLDSLDIPSKLFCEKLKALVMEHICENSYNLTSVKRENKDKKIVFIHIDENDIPEDEKKVIELMRDLLNINICDDKDDLTYYSTLQVLYRENYNKIRGLMTKFVFTKTDKTKRLCLCNREWYYGELTKHLKARFEYIDEKVEDKVFDKYPYMYLLVKDHKTPIDSRLIVAYNVDNDDYSRELSDISKKYYKIINDKMKTEDGIKIIKDSFDIYEIVNKFVFNGDEIIKTGDIKLMFDNLNHQDIIKYGVSYGKKLGLNINKTFIRKVLENCLVKVKDKIYRQKKGLPMGNPLSPILCVLTIKGYIDTLDVRYTKNVKGLLYVDDILCKGLQYDINDLWNEICKGLNLQIIDTKFEETKKYCMMDWDPMTRKIYYNIRNQRKHHNFIPDINNYYNTRNQVPLSIFKGYQNLINKLTPYDYKREEDLKYLQYRIITDLQYENLCLCKYRLYFRRKREELLTTFGIVERLNKDLITHFKISEKDYNEKVKTVLNKISSNLIVLVD